MSAAKTKKTKAKAPPAVTDLQSRREQAQQRAAAAKKEARAAKERSREARRLFKQAKQVAREAKKELERISAKLKKVIGASARAGGVPKKSAGKRIDSRIAVERKSRKKAVSAERKTANSVGQSSAPQSRGRKRTTSKRTTAQEAAPVSEIAQQRVATAVAGTESEPSLD